jgi:hypothetical protein
MAESNVFGIFFRFVSPCRSFGTACRTGISPALESPVVVKWMPAGIAERQPKQATKNCVSQSQEGADPQRQRCMA